jgi:hypothetical protein
LVASQASAACPTSADPIDTDRPDVTNSSLVVPAGSLQAENGIDLTSEQHSLVGEGTNTRLRLGVGGCTELLVDLDDIERSLNGHGPSGATDVTPAVKHQLLSGDVSLSGVVGASIPTGTGRLVGKGYQPYLQFPGSAAIADDWALNGMLTAFFFPRQPNAVLAGQATLSLERELGERADAFAEYVADFPVHSIAVQRLNSGAAYRLTPNQQIDFHAGVGIGANAPAWFFGIGYSFRFDGLF